MVAKDKHYYYTDKWNFDNQINHKLSNSLWKIQQTTDSQITQILKFILEQYIGNHMEHLF